jgi:hypothetical protein
MGRTPWIGVVGDKSSGSFDYPSVARLLRGAQDDRGRGFLRPSAHSRAKNAREWGPEGPLFHRVRQSAISTRQSARVGRIFCTVMRRMAAGNWPFGSLALYLN